VVAAGVFFITVDHSQEVRGEIHQGALFLRFPFFPVLLVLFVVCFGAAATTASQPP
jgi:hypothetical protein